MDDASTSIEYCGLFSKLSNETLCKSVQDLSWSFLIGGASVFHLPFSNSALCFLVCCAASCLSYCPIGHPSTSDRDAHRQYCRSGANKFAPVGIVRNEFSTIRDLPGAYVLVNCHPSPTSRSLSLWNLSKSNNFVFYELFPRTVPQETYPSICWLNQSESSVVDLRSFDFRKFAECKTTSESIHAASPTRLYALGTVCIVSKKYRSRPYPENPSKTSTQKVFCSQISRIEFGMVLCRTDVS